MHRRAAGALRERPRRRHFLRLLEFSALRAHGACLPPLRERPSRQVWRDFPLPRLRRGHRRACPVCDGWLNARMGRYGRFLGCSNFPDCDYTRTTCRSKERRPEALRKTRNPDGGEDSLTLPARRSCRLRHPASSVETWRCFAPTDFLQHSVLVWLSRPTRDGLNPSMGKVLVTGVSYEARVRVVGLNRRWNFGDEYAYAVIIHADGEGMYYRFLGSRR